MKRLSDTVVAALIATAVIACGDKLSEPIADMMRDAGETLADAGTLFDGATPDHRGDGSTPDAADHGNDSGGTVSDASAQPCATCTVSGPIELQGPVRVVTADTDMGQLRRGTIALVQETYDELTPGPFVLTDALPIAIGTGVNTNFILELSYTNPGECNDEAGRVRVVTLQSSSTASASGQSAISGSVTGARFAIPAGKVLCGRGGGFWAGFVPY